MKYFKIIILLFLFPFIMSTITHKFYVSTTNIEYVKEKNAIQIITKIFTEDIEQALQERYDSSISLDSKKETESVEILLKKYLNQKLKFIVNGISVKINYIGKEHDMDITKVYFEIENISELRSIEVENKVLIDMFSEQQNIIHLKTPESRRSLILDKNKPKGLLNFN